MPMRIDLHCDTVTMLHKNETIGAKPLQGVPGEPEIIRDTFAVLCYFYTNRVFSGPGSKRSVNNQLKRIYGNFTQMLDSYPEDSSRCAAFLTWSAADSRERSVRC